MVISCIVSVMLSVRRKNIMKLDQITIRTSRFDEETAFYRDIVKLQIEREIREENLHIVFLSNGEGETCIEIIQDEEAQLSGNPYLSIGFHTQDAEQLRNKLIELDYDASPMESPAPVVRFFFVKDPAGVRVQFVEGGK